jgi:CCR4-NOT transcription complex subunit 6
MYNQRQQQGHNNVFMNGGHGHQQYGMQMNASKPFQNQQHQPHPQHRQQQDHNGHGHGGNFGSHQHNASSSGFTASTPQFNPTQLRNGTPNHMQNGLNRPPNEHWGEQLKLYRECQELTGAHPHARIHGSNKSVSSADSDRPEREQEERRRINGDKNIDKQSWTELDLGGQALRALANGMFNFKFLTKLYLRDNNLSAIPERIGKLRALTHLDLSKNHLSFLPQELGMLVNLKTLLLFDNDLETLPYEIGQLYHLDMLGIEGNERMNPEIKELMMENGTKALVAWLQDSAPSEFRKTWYVLNRNTDKLFSARITTRSRLDCSR